MNVHNLLFPPMAQMHPDVGSTSSIRIHLHYLRNLRSVIGVTFALNLICCAAAQGAPPAVKYLFPAGAQRGVTTEITANGDFSNWPPKTWASHPGVHVSCGQEKGKLSFTVEPNTGAGVHFIRLYDDEGASKPMPFVVGNLPEVVEKSSNDSPDKAEALSSSMVTVSGRLEKRDDVDVYSVELIESQTLVASVLANEKLASPMDGVLQILTAGGSVLAQHDDWHGLDPQLVFTAPSAGKYLVRIFAFPAQPDSRIGLAGGDAFLYRLTITTGSFIDFPWPLAVKQQETTDVKLIGWNLADPIHRQTVTAAGHPFVIDGDQLAGQLLLAVEPHACPIEVEPNNISEPQALELPATISGRLQTLSDNDVFRFKAKRGETVLFQLDGRDLGSPLDAVLEVTDSSGKSLVRTDDSNKRRDPELSWKAPEDGDYQVAVSDLHGRGGERFYYRLRAAMAQPDFRAKSPEHAFVGSVGKPLEVTLDLDRQHGFDQEIVIRAEGLPDTITAEPATSASSGETAKKVKLKLTATAAYSGPFRIVASTSGPESLHRAAAFNISDDAEITDLWITFKAEKTE
ncbi:MAG: PPC domain-containing protein [Pirellulales bacterium]